MPYNSLITRADIAALNTEQVSTAMLSALPQSSAALQLFKRIPVAKSQVRFPVLSALPTAYWVTGDTGLKQTTESAWTNVYMYIEELAAIVPIPDAVLEDADFDVTAAVTPLVADAIGTKLDAAIFFGVEKPSTWPDDIATDAIAAGNTVFRGTAANLGGIAEDINLLMATVEADGYDVNGFVANRTFRSRIRGARASDGQKLLDVTNETVEGVRVVYGMGGLWPATGDSDVELFAGDFTKGLLGVRRDITIDKSNEAVIQDGSGAIVYNAYQQDLTLLRVTFRVGWTVANPVNRYQATEANRYPFGVLRSPNI